MCTSDSVLKNRNWTILSIKFIVFVKKSNKNLDEISRLIDDATASTQETAAAAEELANLAENLNTLVSKFKTTNSWKS